MEACPRLDMFPQTPFVCAQESSNLGIAIKKLIRLQYNENPEDFRTEVTSFMTLRNDSCVKMITNGDIGLKNLKKYYCQLVFFQNRFKVLESPLMKKGPFDFPWSEADDDLLMGPTNYDNLDSEMAFVLYNIGVMFTFLANRESRTGSESMKTACTYYQNAAWAFHTLPDRHPQALNEDTCLNTDYLTLLSQICLAQAQECILEKSILDHKKPTIIVKVAAQIVEFYKQVMVKLEGAKTNLKKSCGNDYIKIISKYSQYKMLFYNAVAQFFMGVNQEDESKWGEAVAYLDRAQKSLKSTMDPIKSCNILSKSNAKEAVNFANDVIEGKFNIAKRENEFIYHDKVPDDLPELKGQTLVKGIGFEVNEANGGKDIFAKLIPLEAHTASSLYSEEKAKVLRELGTKIENKDEELSNFLLSMNLEQVPNAGDHIALPQELIECAAGFSAVNDNPVKKLSEAMAKLAGTSADVQATINEIQDAFDHENEQAKEFKAIVGKPPKPLDQALSEELKRYKEAHKVASESNVTLHKAIQVHVSNLKTLSKPLADLQKDIPSVADLDPEAEASIAEFQRLINKVDEMKKQRETLIDKVRVDILNDDITKKLVLHKDKEMPEIFSAELKKHDTNKGYIEQNLNAQANIIKAITEVNAKYAPTRRKVADLIEARREKISTLIDSFNVYENLTLKSSKALEFYEKLNTNVSDLKKKVSKAMEENEQEKDAVIAKLAAPKPTAPAQAAPPSTKPTLKDYLNAGGVPRPSGAVPQPYPGYVNPATSSHQQYRQPQMMYQPPASFNSQFQPPTSQNYQPPPQRYPAHFTPTSGQNYPYPSGYQIQPGQIPQSFHNQPQQMYPGYHPAQQQHPQMTSTPQQPNTSQEPINPNDLSLI